MCCCTGGEQPYIMCAEVTAGASTSSSLLVLSFEEKTEEVDGKKSILLLRQFFQLRISENFILRAANWFGASKTELGYNCSLDTQRYHHQMRLERKDEKRIKRCCSPPSDSTRQHYLLPRSLVYFYLFSILPSFTLDNIKPL